MQFVAWRGPLRRVSRARRRPLPLGRRRCRPGSRPRRGRRRRPVARRAARRHRGRGHPRARVRPARPPGSARRDVHALPLRARGMGRPRHPPDAGDRHAHRGGGRAAPGGRCAGGVAPPARSGARARSQTGSPSSGPDGRLVYANDAAARTLGYDSPEALLAVSPEEIVGAFELFDEQRRPLPLEELPGRLALTGVVSPERLVFYRVRATGEERWSLVRARPIVAADGSVEAAVIVFHDVSDRRRQEETVQFVSGASVLLSSSLDIETTLASVARLAVPRIADWCIVYMREDDGTIRTARDRARGRRCPGRRRRARPLPARRRGRGRRAARRPHRADAAARRRLRRRADGGRHRPRGSRRRAEADRARVVPLRPAHRPRPDARRDLAPVERVRPSVRPRREGARRAARRAGGARRRQRAPVPGGGAGGGARAAAERAAPAPEPGCAARQLRERPGRAARRADGPRSRDRRRRPRRHDHRRRRRGRGDGQGGRRAGHAAAGCGRPRGTAPRARRDGRSARSSSSAPATVRSAPRTRRSSSSWRRWRRSRSRSSAPRPSESASSSSSAARAPSSRQCSGSCPRV